MSQNDLVYLEALKASETTEAPGIGLSTSSDKLSIPSGVKTEIDVVQFIKMMPHATRPTRATDGAVGYDLTSIAMYVIPAYGLVYQD